MNTNAYEKIIKEADLDNKPIDYRIAWREGFNTAMEYAVKVMNGKEPV